MPLFETIFFIGFVLMLVAFVYSFINAIKQRRINNKSPRLTVDATVVEKNRVVSHHQQPGMNNGMMTESVSYYATFRVESGDCMKFSMNSYEYNMIIEGDYGKLSFQGTRFLGFERIK